MQKCSRSNKRKHMPADKNDRVTIAVSRETHEAHSRIASLLGLDLKEATEQAVSEWNRKNAPAARKKANQLIGSSH
jgi:hypothetical protein